MRTLAIVLVLVMLAGCGESGPPLAPVKGKVTLNGQPYTKGTVVFQPSGGGPTGIGMTDVNGDYSVWTSGRKGAPLGPHTVMVTTIADPSATQVAPAEMRSDDPRYADQANSEAADYVKAAKFLEPANDERLEELERDLLR